MKHCCLWYSLTSILALVSTSSVDGQGYSPETAIQKVTASAGLHVKLFASEPDISQCILVKCDDRGRTWTIQYLQYPNPAGLTRVQVDRWSRTVYDRIPEPPPHGPKGADRITILEDTDGDGQADQFKDFASDLNLVTGLAFGHGGVYVLNVPYLLFYPDRDRNDVPDRDPEVLLKGFGMEDAQSFSNHLTWGPDGWLYGVNGSTTTCNIRGIEFQQGLWRYQPVSGEFELFCEGGANCFGVTFDARGETFYSTNGGPFLHAVQGGYFFKSFGKHGPLHNPFAYHFFANLECDQVPGGPPTGGTIYHGGAFPDRFDGTFIAGNFLGHSASSWRVEPTGATVRAVFSEQLMDAHDNWCGPTDMCLGPDGSMFLSDFHDQRTSHPDPDANWDRSNGRIYKIEADRLHPLVAEDVRDLTSDELVNLMQHTNRWYADRARCELAYRRDTAVWPRLREMAQGREDEPTSLQGLWALHVSGGLDDDTSLALLDHPFPYIRYWTIRFLGDRRQTTNEQAIRLAQLAHQETVKSVQLQLACAARRLPGEVGLPILENLLRSFAGQDDERVRWMIWWALESKAMSDTPRLLEFFEDSDSWQGEVGREHGLLLVRRYAADGSSAGYAACLRLLECVPRQHLAAGHDQLNQGLAERSQGLASVGQGGLFQGQALVDSGQAQHEARSFDRLSDKMQEYIARQWHDHPDDSLYLELALRADVPRARERLSELLADESASDTAQLECLRIAQEFPHEKTLPQVQRLALAGATDDIRLAALNVLAGQSDPDLAHELLQAYATSSTTVQSKIRDLLFARVDSAIMFLARVDERNIDSQSIPIDQLRRVALHDDDRLDELLRKHWGNIGPGSPEEKLATMRRYNNDLRNGTGDPVTGKILYTKHCAVCHTFHDEGNKIGPDLTTANRQDRAALLANLVDPSAVIRREYINYIVETYNGRVLNGLIAEQDGASLTILDAKNERTRIPRADVEVLVESELSLMPEKLLDELTPQQICDLFGYLQK